MRYNTCSGQDMAARLSTGRCDCLRGVPPSQHVCSSISSTQAFAKSPTPPSPAEQPPEQEDHQQAAQRGARAALAVKGHRLRARQAAAPRERWGAAGG